MLYNIALSALRLNYRTTDPDSDNNITVKLLRGIYPLALSKALADMDLNRTSAVEKLELIEDAEHPHYSLIYKYPSNCALFRRILSPFPTDNRETRIPFGTSMIDGQDVIMTNHPNAYGQFIPTDLNLSVLNPNAVMAVGFQMAIMAPSQITGKGSTGLRQSLMQEYTLYKGEAQQDDLHENIDTTPDEFKSDFIQARLGSYRALR